MLLRRCTRTAQLFGVLIAMLALGGCGGAAALKSTGNPQQIAQSDGASKHDALAASIPAEALTLFEQATASMASGDVAVAEQRFKAFQVQYPQYPGAHVNLAIIYVSNGSDAAAWAEVDAALLLQPNHPAALNQLGMLLRKNGRFLEAEAAYLKAVTVSPDYALAHYNLGVLYELYLQRLDAALEHFASYLSLVGEDAEVAKWVKDLTRRVAASQRTANVAD